MLAFSEMLLLKLFLKLWRYECAVNIEELIKLEDVMAEHSLGPNGGKPATLSYILFCF